MGYLRMSKDRTSLVYLPFARPTLFFAAEWLPSVEPARIRILCDLLQALGEQKAQTPRTIIFTQSIKQCSLLYRWFWAALGEQRFVSGQPQTTEYELVNMLHSHTPLETKQHVLKLLRSSSSALRVVIATAALAYGVNIKDVRQVIHIQPPRTMVDLVQHTGRAGRDHDDTCICLLLYSSMGLRLCDQSIKDYLQATGCRREVIRSFFDGPATLKTNTRKRVFVFSAGPAVELPDRPCCSCCQPSYVPSQARESDDDSANEQHDEPSQAGDGEQTVDEDDENDDDG